MTHDEKTRQRIPKGQSRMDNPETLATQGTQGEKTRQRIPKGKTRMDNPETLAHTTQDEDKQNTIQHRNLNR